MEHVPSIGELWNFTEMHGGGGRFLTNEQDNKQLYHTWHNSPNTESIDLISDTQNRKGRQGHKKQKWDDHPIAKGVRDQGALPFNDQFVDQGGH